MSVASKNPFALLSEDGEAPVAAAPAKKNEPASASSRPAREIPGAVRRGGAAGAQRGGRGGAARGPIAAEGETREARDARSTDRGRGGRGGRGRGRGGRGREFDRHSQTGRTDSTKAIAQGWGGDDPKREQEAEEGAALDAVAEESGAATPANAEPAADGAEAAAGAEGEAAAAAAPVEEVDNTKTYDEYLAELAAKKAAINGNKSAAPRKPEDFKEVGTKVQKASEEEESYFAATSGSKESRQKTRKEKQALEIDTYFEAPARDSERGGRGGRGGARGGASRGRGGDRGRGAPGAGRGRGGPGAGGRGGRGGQGANFSLDDNRAFPSLGA